MRRDRKSTRLNSSHTEIYTLSLHDALPISNRFRHWNYSAEGDISKSEPPFVNARLLLNIRKDAPRSEEHTSELQSHRDLHSFPTRRSSDLKSIPALELFG